MRSSVEGVEMRAEEFLVEREDVTSLYGSVMWWN